MNLFIRAVAPNSMINTRACFSHNFFLRYDAFRIATYFELRRYTNAIRRKTPRANVFTRFGEFQRQNSLETVKSAEQRLRRLNGAIRIFAAAWKRYRRVYNFQLKHAERNVYILWKKSLLNNAASIFTVQKFPS